MLMFFYLFLIIYSSYFLHLTGFTIVVKPFKNFRSYNQNILSKNYQAQLNHNSNNRLFTRLYSAENGQDDSNPYYSGLDAYQILEISRDADAKAVKQAFRKLVGKWHPDKFPLEDKDKKKEATFRMEKINRAYYILSDEDRRRRYDLYGEQGVGSSDAAEEEIKRSGGIPMGGFGGFGNGFQVSGDDFDISSLFDLFGGMGGGGDRQRKRNPNAPTPGEDVQMQIDVPFMTSITGGNQKVFVRRSKDCSTCSGSGVKPGSKVSTCNICKGSGYVNEVQKSPFGMISQTTVCKKCKGSGQDIEEHCGTCKGKGTISQNDEITIKIPPGIEHETVLRIKGEGHAGKKGGPKGDLYVQVNLKKDPKFDRKGLDIYTEESISYIDAILGTTLTVSTVDGSTDIKIPAGTQPDQKFRIKGKGVPRLNNSGSRGDAFVTIKVKIPTKVNSKEKELLEQIKGLES